MIILASTASAGTAWSSWFLAVAAVLVSGLLLVGPALRRRYPVACWLLEVLTKVLDVPVGDQAGGEAEESLVDVVAS
ncbi:hypothetical protein ACIP5U_39905, partial [Streptomyces sp. NPDC088788]